MDFKLDFDADKALMTFDKAGDIGNNVYLSLMIDRGSWWADPNFGSRLHLLRREKNTPRTELLAREYAREALQWLLDTGRATAIDIVTQRDRSQNLDRLGLLVTVTQADGRQVTFERFVEVV